MPIWNILSQVSINVSCYPICMWKVQKYNKIPSQTQMYMLSTLEAAWAAATMPWLSSWSQGMWAWQRVGSGPWTLEEQTLSCSMDCWPRSPGMLSLKIKMLRRAGYSSRMSSWQHKRSPSLWIGTWADEIGNWHGSARTCWAHWGQRKVRTSSGNKGVSPGKSTGMLSGLADVGSGKPRHR